MTDQQPPMKSGLKRIRRLVAILLILSIALTTSYAALSLYVATQLIKIAPHPLEGTPGSLGLAYHTVTFPSRQDHIPLQGWLIPGILPNGHLTVQRTILVIHGSSGNRTDNSVGILKFSSDLVHHGFAVFAIDLRGHGQSPAAPLSLGYYEQRDVLGAVDFLHTGQELYPQLGRPHVIAGWGVSMGGSTLLLAAASEPSIASIVSDCAYADILPIIQREIPAQGHLPTVFTPGIIFAAQVLYGIDLTQVRPVDVVSKIAPRPLFFIHGAADVYVPPGNMNQLATAARSAGNSNVQTWLTTDAGHAQSYLMYTQEYVQRVVAFYERTLGPDTGAGQPQ